MSVKEALIGFRVNDEMHEEWESTVGDMAWANRTNKAEIMRELTRRFLEDEELQDEVIERINEDDARADDSAQEDEDE